MSATHDERIGIEFISVLGQPPVEFIGVAADLGCRNIGIALEPIVTWSGYSHWSLRTDATLRRETKAALADRGVSISVGEGFFAWPRADLRDAEADLDLMAELGVRRVNMLSANPDQARTFDQCAVFAELAGKRGMTATLEFLPGMPMTANLEEALAVVRHVDRPNFGLLIDTMHLFRSGSSVADVAALDPASIGYVQLCDVPLVSRYADYSDEARFDRLAPGDGELPLAEFVAILPPDVIIGLEVPMLAQAEAGIGPRERLKAAVEKTRAMLSRATQAQAQV
jgi:sugar phosphate isomerase/epimerase